MVLDDKEKVVHFRVQVNKQRLPKAAQVILQYILLLPKIY